MEPSVFISKFKSRFLWLNLLAMAVVIVVIAIGLQFAMDFYTHHGETITVPDVRKQPCEGSIDMLEDMGFIVEVNDTGYVKNLPPGTILMQLPLPGTVVKSGRTIYLTINATDSPTLTLPDVIDNSSWREAEARLKTLGFKVGPPQYVFGEKDWVYGILVNGRNVTTGQKISVESTLIVQVGNGHRDASDSVYVTDRQVDPFEEIYEDVSIDEGGSGDSGEKDDFEVIE